MVRRKGRCGTWCANLCFISNNIKIESTQKNPYAHANSPEADGRAAHIPASKHQQSTGCWPKCARVWHTTTLPFAILPFSVKSFKEKKGGIEYCRNRRVQVHERSCATSRQQHKSLQKVHQPLRKLRAESAWVRIAVQFLKLF